MVGQFGQAWRHATYEASPDARAVNNARLFPAPSPDAARLNKMIDSPVGAGLSGIANLFGASQHTQDALLNTGAVAEAFGGGLAGFQMPKAPQAGQVASISRSRSTSRGPVEAGEAGRFGDLAARAVTGDQLTPHHMPQAAAGFTSRANGGALMLPEAEHMLTRTYGFKGAITAQNESGMGFRDVLARDIRDVRSIGGSRYNSGLRDLTDYYRSRFPELMKKQ